MKKQIAHSAVRSTGARSPWVRALEKHFLPHVRKPLLEPCIAARWLLVPLFSPKNVVPDWEVRRNILLLYSWLLKTLWPRVPVVKRMEGWWLALLVLSFRRQTPRR